MATITNAMREATFQITAGKAVLYGEETLWRCAGAGLICRVDGEWVATEQGVAAAREHEAIVAKRRVASRAASRGRAAALASVGMRRTRHGWE